MSFYKCFIDLVIGFCFVWSIIETLLALKVGTYPMWVQHYSSDGHAVLAMLFAFLSAILWDLKEA